MGQGQGLGFPTAKQRNRSPDRDRPARRRGPREDRPRARSPPRRRPRSRSVSPRSRSAWVLGTHLMIRYLLILVLASFYGRVQQLVSIE